MALIAVPTGWNIQTLVFDEYSVLYRRHEFADGVRSKIYKCHPHVHWCRQSSHSDLTLVDTSFATNVGSSLVIWRTRQPTPYTPGGTGRALSLKSPVRRLLGVHPRYGLRASYPVFNAAKFVPTNESASACTAPEFSEQHDCQQKEFATEQPLDDVVRDRNQNSYHLYSLRPSFARRIAARKLRSRE